VDALVTGWHESQASHLSLLEAVAGSELVQRAYDGAIEAGYLWHEFGDSCLFFPKKRRRSNQSPARGAFTGRRTAPHLDHVALKASELGASERLQPSRSWRI
jgi:Queuosine biosynthesis protein